MRTRSLNPVAAFLAAIGSLLPAAEAVASSADNGVSSPTIYATVNSSGLVSGSEHIRDGVLVVNSDIADSVGIQVNDDGFAYGYISEKVEIDLGKENGSVGVLTEGTEMTFNASASIKADTVLRGDYVGLMGANSDYEFVGKVDMHDGKIESGHGSELNYVGIGDLGTFVGYAGTSFTLGETPTTQGETFLRVGNLQLAAGSTVTVQGDRPDGTDAAVDNRILAVGSLSAPPPVGDYVHNAQGSASIRVKDDGILVLGTSLMKGNSLEEVEQKILGVAGDGQIADGNVGGSTLIVGDDYEFVGGFSIEIGNVSEEHAGTEGIHIGSDGRLIIHFENDKTDNADGQSAVLKAISESKVADTVTADAGATLVLHNWDGSSFNIGAFDPENIYAYGGARIDFDAEGNAVRLWCKDIAGLHASAIVGVVEAAENSGTLSALPGYELIKDTLAEEDVGRDVYANMVDGAVFLPVTSGLATAAERVLADTVNTIMAHDVSLFEGKGHWWVDGKSSKIKADRIFSGGSGSFGFDADVTAATLGYDFALGKDWVMTAAVSFAGIDVESRGLISRTTGDMSLATFAASAARNFENFELRLGLAYSRAMGDSHQLLVKHHVEADTSVDFAVAAARVTGHSLTDMLHLAPYAQLSVTAARMDDEVITDNSTEEGISGDAFDTSAEDRVWATLEAGADAAMQFEVVDGYTLRPSLGASVRTSFGQTDWKIQSRLFDGKGLSSAVYESAQTFGARIRAGIELASSGWHEPNRWLFGSSKASSVEPYAWKVILQGEYEAASSGENTGSMSLQFRQLF